MGKTLENNRQRGHKYNLKDLAAGLAHKLRCVFVQAKIKVHLAGIGKQLVVFAGVNTLPSAS